MYVVQKGEPVLVARGNRAGVMYVASTDGDTALLTRKPDGRGYRVRVMVRHIYSYLSNPVVRLNASGSSYPGF